MIGVEFLVLILTVVMVLEAFLIIRFKRKCDLLRETMERDRQIMMRDAGPFPPKPGAWTRGAGGVLRRSPEPGAPAG